MIISCASKIDLSDEVPFRSIDRLSLIDDVNPSTFDAKQE